MKALVIDDSRTMRRMIVSYISPFGIEAIEAKDGCDALEKLEQNSGFDFALVDWDMPRMNGLEFVKAARSKADYDSIKLMMVTSHNSMQDVGEAINSGADDFLMKPFSEDMIVDKLRLMGVVN